MRTVVDAALGMRAGRLRADLKTALFTRGKRPAVDRNAGGRSAGVTLLGSLAIPLHGLGIVLRYAPAVVVHGAEAPLGRVVPLLGGLAVPLHRFSIVLENAPRAQTGIMRLAPDNDMHPASEF